MKRQGFLNSKKSSGGGGRLSNLLNKDIKELNGIILSLFCVSFLITVGIISYKVNTSYAIFTDTIKGEKTIELTVPNICNEVSIVSSGDTSGANAPVLSENMIPVYYDTCDEVWKKADESNQNSKYVWYDYDNKMWANSVTVSSANRQTYLAADPGTEIPMTDILTMQVWIPRYKYTVWNYNADGTVTSEPQEIDIELENETTTSGEIDCTDNIQGTSDGTSSGTEPTTSEICKLKVTDTICTDETCNGKTYTHPAFTFGEEELRGFWVGKFENSSNGECIPATEINLNTGCNVTTMDVLIKPNVASWRGTMTGTSYTNIVKMNDANNIYGFVEKQDDIHMMKSIQWGAVAYLSHSKYGINGEISLNSSSTFTTGCGPQSLGSISYGTTCNSYNTTLGQSASTTGNIYGIYDMSGGGSDAMMSNMVSPSTNFMSGQNNYTSEATHIYTNSGFDGVLYTKNAVGDYGMYDGAYNTPTQPYYDKYSFGKTYYSAASRNRTKLGEGIREIWVEAAAGWYGDYTEIIHDVAPWMHRGCSYDSGSYGGLFCASSSAGQAHVFHVSRVVIAIPVS